MYVCMYVCMNECMCVKSDMRIKTRVFASSLVSRGRTLGSRTSGAGSGAQTGPLNIFDPSDVEIFDEQTKARLDSTLRMRLSPYRSAA